MRPSLLPGLLTAAKRNRNRGFADVALFELGQAYRGEAPEDQYLAASGVRAGTAKLAGSGRHWDGAAADVDVFDAKADVFAVLAALGFDPGKAQITRDAPAWYHPGRSGTLRLGPKARARALRRDASGDAQGARRGRPRRRLRDLPRRDAAGESEGPRQGRRSRPPTCCRSSATSPSCSMHAVAAGDVVRAALRRRQGADRDRVGVRRVRGRHAGRCRQEVARHRGHAAAGRRDADGQGHRGGRRRRSSPPSRRPPAARSALEAGD